MGFHGSGASCVAFDSVCSDTWMDMFMFDPVQVSQQDPSRVLGGEACLWSENVDEHTLDDKAFTRLAAVAERLWSAEQHRDVVGAQVRFAEFRCRLLRRGFRVGAYIPDHCDVALDESDQRTYYSDVSREALRTRVGVLEEQLVQARAERLSFAMWVIVIGGFVYLGRFFVDKRRTFRDSSPRDRSVSAHMSRSRSPGLIRRVAAQQDLAP
mmetsp:Transcript_50908/g.119306  ORF Transcript_50908/g.119306 Transcript_50908/m.119306 type:complete len:211 (-) Transcript_50908:1498-2130(-)